MATTKGAAGGSIDILATLFSLDNLTVEKFEEIKDKFIALFSNIRHEILRIRNFKMDIHWKHRVISPEQTILHIKALFQEIEDAIDHRGELLVTPFHEFVHTLQLLATSENVDPMGGPSKIVQGISKVEDFVTQLNILIGAFSDALDEAGRVTDIFDRILSDIQSLEDLFLPQNSPRNRTTVTYYKRS